MLLYKCLECVKSDLMHTGIVSHVHVSGTNPKVVHIFYFIFFNFSVSLTY